MSPKEDDLEKEVRRLIADIVELQEDKITPDALFVEDLGMDSMMALEILASLEKKYKIQVPEENLAKFTNLRETVRLVKEYLK